MSRHLQALAVRALQAQPPFRRFGLGLGLRVGFLAPRLFLCLRLVGLPLARGVRGGLALRLVLGLPARRRLGLGLRSRPLLSRFKFAVYMRLQYI